MDVLTFVSLDFSLTRVITPYTNRTNKARRGYFSANKKPLVCHKGPLKCFLQLLVSLAIRGLLEKASNSNFLIPEGQELALFIYPGGNCK